MLLTDHTNNSRVFIMYKSSSVAAVQSCFYFIIVAAAIVLGIGALFLSFVLLYSQRVASQSCETLGELLHRPINHISNITRKYSLIHIYTSSFEILENISKNKNLQWELGPHCVTIQYLMKGN